MDILVSMVPEARRLHAALVAAFPAYMTQVYADRGYLLDRNSVEAIEEATALLDGELAVELELPFRDQHRSPLEVFRAALALVAGSLARAGVSPVAAADERTRSDPYGLDPGSSSILGPDAHDAHVAWGSAKARAFIIGVGPGSRIQRGAIVMSSDADDRGRVVKALESRGTRCQPVRNPAAVALAIENESVLIAIVDLSHRSARDAIDRLVASSVPVVTYGTDIDDLTETGLRAQGVRSVVDRAAFLEDPGRFIPPVV